MVGFTNEDRSVFRFVKAHDVDGCVDYQGITTGLGAHVSMFGQELFIQEANAKNVGQVKVTLQIKILTIYK